MRDYKMSTKILIIIALVILLVFALFPILFPLLSSFRTDNEIFEYAAPFSWHTLWPIDWTLDNYIQLFQQHHFGQYIGNTLLVVGVTIPLSILMCSVAAFAFSFFNFRGKKILFSIFLLTFMIPSEAIALPLYQMVNKMGLINTYWALILPALANGLALFMFTQSFRDIPKDLIDAVRIDGGNYWTCYKSLVMPLSKPIIITICLMIFVNEWNNYLWPLLAARTDAVKTLTIAISKFKEANVTHWSMIYASSMLSALVPILIFLPFQKYFIQGITTSGIKG